MPHTDSGAWRVRAIKCGTYIGGRRKGQRYGPEAVKGFDWRLVSCVKPLRKSGKGFSWIVEEIEGKVVATPTPIPV